VCTFLRRFVQHVLPDGFKKIRHYGLYASSARDKLEQARSILESSAGHPSTTSLSHPTWQQLLRELTGRDVDRCPHCGGAVERIALERHAARGPPDQEVA
jgi:hypothetical protein